VPAGGRREALWRSALLWYLAPDPCEILVWGRSASERAVREVIDLNFTSPHHITPHTSLDIVISSIITTTAIVVNGRSHPLRHGFIELGDTLYVPA
jgi:hypothetical protein